MTDELTKRYKKTESLLDKVSSSFCTAKWLQVNIHLSNVNNHSCHPHVSSSIHNDIKKHGEFPAGSVSLCCIHQAGLAPIENEEESKYKKSFWEWFPDLYKDLKVFHITGGEPLLSPSTFKVLDYILEKPHKDLSVAINTNLSIPDKVFDKNRSRMKVIV
jgi:organic radical activating enzyme